MNAAGAHQENGVARDPAGVRERGRDNLGRAVVPAHRVDCDPNAAGGIGRAPPHGEVVHVAWPSTGKTTARPKKSGREPTINAATTKRPHAAIVNGLAATARTDVRTAVAAPTLRSTSIGNDTTLMISATAAKTKPTALPTTMSCQPAEVVRTWWENSPSEAGTAPPMICAYMVLAATSHAKNIASSTRPNLTMAPMEGERNTSKRCSAETSSPRSRRRLSS